MRTDVVAEDLAAVTLGALALAALVAQEGADDGADEGRVLLRLGVGAARRGGRLGESAVASRLLLVHDLLGSGELAGVLLHEPNSRAISGPDPWNQWVVMPRAV